MTKRQNVSRKPLDVRHACPLCNFQHPTPGCAMCKGSGFVTDRELVGHMPADERLRIFREYH